MFSAIYYAAAFAAALTVRLTLACASCELQLAHHWWKSKGLFKIIHKIALKYTLTKL